MVHVHVCLRASGSDYPSYAIYLSLPRYGCWGICACVPRVAWKEIRDLGDHGLPSWGLLGFRRRSLLIFKAREQDSVYGGSDAMCAEQLAARILELATTSIKRVGAL